MGLVWERGLAYSENHQSPMQFWANQRLKSLYKGEVGVEIKQSYFGLVCFSQRYGINDEYRLGISVMSSNAK